jgi:hypothetical protein
MVHPDGNGMRTVAICGYPFVQYLWLGRHKKSLRYDFGASWGFEIIKKGKETVALAGKEYPCIVSQEGSVPLEYGDEDE